MKTKTTIIMEAQRLEKLGREIEGAIHRAWDQEGRAEIHALSVHVKESAVALRQISGKRPESEWLSSEHTGHKCAACDACIAPAVGDNHINLHPPRRIMIVTKPPFGHFDQPLRRYKLCEECGEEYQNGELYKDPHQKIMDRMTRYTRKERAIQALTSLRQWMFGKRRPSEL